MKAFRSITLLTLSGSIFTFAVLIASGAVYAANWQATAGSQSTDEGIQALAFLPNELWIHVRDSIAWFFPTPEIHTVTFLKQNTEPEQVRPPRPGAGGGCVPPPGTTTPDNSSFDGSKCL